MRKVLIGIIGIVSCFAAMAQQKEKTGSDELFLSKILAGNVFTMGKEQKINDLQWNPHATFKGVYLKHLIVGKDTDNKLSCHIVKIEPGCILDTHMHDGKIEIHEIVAGSGTMYLDGKEINYVPGQICLIPANVPHKVVAGKEGMYILAKFTPSLL
jgi:quercetin dioxygenase-like cupin family protein